MATHKTLTFFKTEVSHEETECVDGVWFSLVIGQRGIDGKEVIELRTWKNGTLEDVVTEWFDRRVRQNRLEGIFEALRDNLRDEWERRQFLEECCGRKHG